MSIEYTILGLLSWQPMTGYDIKKVFADSTMLYWSGNNNQIYTTLVTLHKNGLVSRQNEFQEDGPARKVYSITAQGLAKLKEWMLAEPELPELRHSFLIQLTWADQLNQNELNGLLEKYETEIQMKLAVLQMQARQGNTTPTGATRASSITPTQARSSREAILWEKIQEYWITFYQNELDWVRNLHNHFFNE